MNFSELRNEQARQIIDVEQVYAAYRQASSELQTRYAGSMSWKEISGAEYLYRKVASVSRSLGRRSPETEEVYAAFQNGRSRFDDRKQSLAKRLDEMAPVNRALGIGRLPVASAKILRQLDLVGLMGNSIEVVGTTALFAYERVAGIQVRSDVLATGDVDLLFDSRRKLKLVAINLDADGLIGLLQKADSTFAVAARGSFRAINNSGFMVDLIKPSLKNRLLEGGKASVGGQDDLQGLSWLVNSPKFKQVVIDERGYPLEISVPDPRSFALHKAWLSSKDDREPIKRNRDLEQARLVARIVEGRLPLLKFDGDDLSALPAIMRRAAENIVPSSAAKRDRAEPDW